MKEDEGDGDTKIVQIISYQVQYVEFSLNKIIAYDAEAIESPTLQFILA